MWRRRWGAQAGEESVRVLPTGLGGRGGTRLDGEVSYTRGQLTESLEQETVLFANS